MPDAQRTPNPQIHIVRIARAGMAATSPVDNGSRPSIVGSEAGPAPPFPLRLNGKVIKGFGRGSKEVSTYSLHGTSTPVPTSLSFLVEPHCRPPAPCRCQSLWHFLERRPPRVSPTRGARWVREATAARPLLIARDEAIACASPGEPEGMVPAVRGSGC